MNEKENYPNLVRSSFLPEEKFRRLNDLIKIITQLDNELAESHYIEDSSDPRLIKFGGIEYELIEIRSGVVNADSVGVATLYVQQVPTLICYNFEVSLEHLENMLLMYTTLKANFEYESSYMNTSVNDEIEESES